MCEQWRPRCDDGSSSSGSLHASKGANAGFRQERRCSGTILVFTIAHGGNK